MKSFPQTMLLLWLLLAGSGQALAANYYFSTLIGDDSRSIEEAQNPETPWKTIEKLNEIFGRLEPGDQILFKRGEVFFGGINVTESGTKSAPIVFSAYGEGLDPVISGFIRLSNWKSVGNGIYESEPLPTGSTVNMVVINGVNYAKGRFPNANSGNGGYLNIESSGDKWIKDSKFTNVANFEGGTIVLRTSHWTLERRRITDQSGSQITYNSGTAYSPDPGFGYFIQDHMATLDQYGEWYYDPSSKKISVYFGNGSPDEFTNVQVAAVDILFQPNGNSHLLVENLSLEGANEYGVFYEGGGMENLQLQDAKISFSGIDAVYLVGCSDFTVENCVILNSNNCAFRLLGHDPNTTIRNSVIRNTGMQAGMGGDGDANYAAIYSSSRGLVAEYNRIINTGYIGIRFAFEDVLVKNNYIDHFCAVMDDGSGIYTYDSRGGGDGYDRKVIGNIIINGIGVPEGTNSTYGAAEGIYLDDNSYNVEVTGNTVANCSNKGIFIHNASDFKLSRNHIFNNREQFSTVHDQHGNAITGAEISDNIFFSKEPSQWVSLMKSNSKDFQNIGSFRNNHYVRPLDDSLTILIDYEDGDGARVSQPFTLEDWQSQYGQDQNSEKSPVRIKPYQLDNIKGDNQVSNSTFEEHIIGTWCWSPTTDCNTSWASNSVLGKGALKVDVKGPSFLGMECGEVKDNQYYILRFKGAANKESNIEIFLQQNEQPWHRMTSSRAVKIGTTPNEYELLFSVPVYESSGSLQFGFGDPGVIYWLDDIEFMEVDANMTNPDSYIRFEYNPSKEKQTIFLEEAYMDARGRSYTGSFELNPFESVILILDMDKSDRPDQDPDTDPNADPNPEPDQPEEEPNNDPNPDSDTNPDTNPDEQPDPDPDQNPEPEPDPEEEPDDPETAPPFPGPKFGFGNGFQRDRDKPRNPQKPNRNGRHGLPENAVYDWALYPNPVSNYNPELNVEFFTHHKEVTLTVVDQYGRTMDVVQPDAEKGWNNVRLDTTRFPTGTYYIYNSDAPAPARQAYRFVVMDD